MIREAILQRWERIAGISFKGESIFIIKCYLLSVRCCAIYKFIQNAAHTPHISTLMIILIQKNNLRSSVPSCLNDRRYISFLLFPLFLVLNKYLPNAFFEFFLSGNSFFVILTSHNMFVLCLSCFLNLRFYLRLWWRNSPKAKITYFNTTVSVY